MIRRPLLIGTAAFVLAIIVIKFYGYFIGLAMTILMLLLYIISKSNISKNLCLIGLVFYLISYVSMYYYDAYEDPLLKISRSRNELQGKVVKCTLRNIGEDNEHYVLDVKTSNSKNQIRVNYYNKGQDANSYKSEYEIIPGDLISFAGEIAIPSVKSNPNCFDYQLYLKSTGINTTMTASRVNVTKRRYSIQGKLYYFKSEFVNHIKESGYQDTAAFIKGIMFGDKGELDEDVIEDFQKNGTAHVLAVSGLHVGFLYALLCKVWPWRKRKAFFIFVLSSLICYCLLSDMSPSVLRASAMIVMHIFAQMTNRRYDLSSAAFAVVICGLLHNPYLLFNTSFQLSLLAVLSINLMLPYIRKFSTGVFAGSIAVQLGMLPYTMYTFNYISLGAFLINVPIIMLVGLLVPIGIIIFILTSVGVSLLGVDCIVLDLLCQGINRINSWTCIDGVTNLTVTSPSRTLLALYYLSLLLFMSEQGRLMIMRSDFRRVLAIATAVIITSCSFGYSTRTGFENIQLTFVDVGQGDCIHVRTKDGRNYLIDGGGSENYNVGKKTLKPYLLKNGVRKLDGVIVTHLHTDHYKGLMELCNEGMVGDIYVYDGNNVIEEQIIEKTSLNSNAIHYVYKGMNLTLGENAILSIIWPNKQSESYYESIANDSTKENEISLVMKLNIGGVTTLITGDIDDNGEKDLLKNVKTSLKTDILKVAHHGSKYSSSDDFLKAASPTYSVIQVGKNNYGHPTREAMDRLEACRSQIKRNDLLGAIGFDISRGDIKNVVTVKH